MKFKALLSFLIISLTFVLSVNAQVPDRSGWWKFDDAADLVKATIGDPLLIVGMQTSVDGPLEGNKATQIPLGNYLLMTHKIAANGGGTMVNEYTLQIDFAIPEANIWHAFFQTDLTNGGDADLFLNTSNSVGVGELGYTSNSVEANTWYRMIVSVKNGEFFKVYVDGQLWIDGAARDIDGRFALADKLMIFGDNDGDDGTINCSELGIWDVALDEEQVKSLGGATGERVPVRTKMGLWRFDDAADLLKAEVGEALVLSGTQQSVAGPDEANKAVQLDAGSYLKMTTGILPNGGGTLTNEYSIQIDFAVPQTGAWHAFFQTDIANGSDADLFTNTSDHIGTAATGYSANAITANTWYRMVVTVKNGEFYRIYINGDLWLEGTQQDIDSRFALGSELLLFADNDGEDGTILCAEVAIWEVALTEAEVLELGTDPVSPMPERMGQWKFDDVLDLMKATIGNDLVQNGNVTSAVGPANYNLAVNVPSGSYLTMAHGMFGNGDGFMVNEYTLQIDFMIPEADIWHCFMQTDPNNTGDGDLFTNTSNKIGTAATSYTADAIVANTWYRMVIVVKNGSYFKLFIDGQPWLSGAGQGVDGRYALAETLLMFADDDAEDGTVHCSEISIWDVPLTDEQVAKLGNATTIPTAVNDIQLNENSDLGQNYPNPFDNTTTFDYRVREAGKVSFQVLDITGRVVKEIEKGVQGAGNYKLELSAENLNNGIYFMKMNAGKLTSTRKMIVR